MLLEERGAGGEACAPGVRLSRHVRLLFEVGSSAA